MGDVPPGYQEVRYVVSIDSPAPRYELDRLLAMAERHSPYLDVFGRAIALKRAPASTARRPEHGSPTAAARPALRLGPSGRGVRGGLARPARAGAFPDAGHGGPAAGRARARRRLRHRARQLPRRRSGRRQRARSSAPTSRARWSRRRAAAPSLRDLAHVRFERGDAEALPLPDASFDAAVCALGLMYVPDPVRALCEMRRLLRPGGRAAAAVWGARRNCGWAEIFPITDARVASEVCPMFFHPRHQGHARARLRGRRLRRRPLGAAFDHAALRLRRGRARRGVPRRAGRARLQPLRRGDQAARSMPSISPPSPPIGAAAATRCRASSWSPPPAARCPSEHSPSNPSQMAQARRRAMTMTNGQP